MVSAKVRKRTRPLVVDQAKNTGAAAGAVEVRKSGEADLAITDGTDIITVLNFSCVLSTEQEKKYIDHCLVITQETDHNGYENET